MRKSVEAFYKEAVNKDINERISIKGTVVCDAIEQYAKLYYQAKVKKIAKPNVNGNEPLFTATEIRKKLLQMNPQIKEDSTKTNPFLYESTKKWYEELGE